MLFAKQKQHPPVKQKNEKKFSVHHQRRQSRKKCERLSRSERVCRVQPRGWQWQQQRNSAPSWLNLSLLQAAYCLKYAFKSSVVPNRINLRADLELIFVVRGHISMKRVPQRGRGVPSSWGTSPDSGFTLVCKCACQKRKQTQEKEVRQRPP